MSRFFDRTGVFWLALAIGLLGQSVAYRYYGRLLGGWDAQFYYAGARSLVFDQDLDISNDLVQTPSSSPFDRETPRDFAALPRAASGRVINKYPVGLSLLEAPLIALGHQLRRVAEASGTTFDAPAGYSWLEINTVAVGLMILVAAGLQCLELHLRSWVDPPWSLALTLAAWMGTSLFAYSAVFPFMAHGAGFALVAAQLAATDRLRAPSADYRRWLLLGSLAALLYLVRPQAVVILPLLLAAVLLETRARPAAWLLPLTLTVLPCLLVIGLQLAINAQQTGVWTWNAYSANGEGFRWLQPRASVVLWSAGRGLLLFSPLVLLSALGFLSQRPSREFAVPYALAIFALGQIYLVACWSSPEQGDSFGMRMVCEAVPAFGIGLALLLKGKARGMRGVLLFLALLCVAWTSLLLLVYVREVIPYDLTHHQLWERIQDAL